MFGFDGDVVVVYWNVVVVDVYVFIRFRVDVVCIGGRYIVDGNVFNGYIIVKFRIYGLKGRVDNFYVFYLYIFVMDGMYERGMEEMMV